MTWGVVAILVGYLGVLLSFGWTGLALVGLHAAVLLLAAKMTDRKPDATDQEGGSARTQARRPPPG